MGNPVKTSWKAEHFTKDTHRSQNKSAGTGRKEGFGVKDLAETIGGDAGYGVRGGARGIIDGRARLVSSSVFCCANKRAYRRHP
jgi:hypothetical protein